MLRKSLLLTLIIGCACFMFTAPEARAVDPVTIALLAPVAIKAAQVAQPYVVKGLINGGKGMLLAGKDMIELFLLPWGILEMTIGAPFGFFKKGIKHVVIGGIAPFKMAFHLAMFPVYMTGLVPAR